MLGFPKRSVSFGGASNGSKPIEAPNRRRPPRHLHHLTLLLRVGVAKIDGILRQVQNVREISDDPNCVFRIAIRRAAHEREVGSGLRICRGNLIVELHLWNEHLSPLARMPSPLCRAVRIRWQFVYSLEVLGKYLKQQSRNQEIAAICFGLPVRRNETRRGLRRLVRRYGFLPIRTEASMFASWGGLWPVALAWAFNPFAMHARAFVLGRQEFWAPGAAFRTWPGVAPLDVESEPAGALRDLPKESYGI